MADYEVSKLMWIGVVVALAASIFAIAQPNIKSLAGSTLDNVHKIIDGNTNNGGNTERPDENDAKWVHKGLYATNGKWVSDADGNVVVYAQDQSKPITYNPTGISFNNEDGSPVAEQWKFVNLSFADKVVVEKLATSDINIASMAFSFAYQGQDLETITGLENWDVSNATQLNQTFANFPKLKALDLSSWNVSNVRTFNGTFMNTTALNSLNLKNWDFKAMSESSTGDMGMMFSGSGLTSLDLTSAKNIKPRQLSGTFGNMTNLTTLKLKNWDLSNWTDMTDMFNGDTKLATLDLTGFTPGAYDENRSPSAANGLSSELSDKVLNTFFKK